MGTRLTINSVVPYCTGAPPELVCFYLTLLFLLVEGKRGEGEEERKKDERRVKERGWINYTLKYQQIDYINIIFIIIRVAA